MADPMCGSSLAGSMTKPMTKKTKTQALTLVALLTAFAAPAHASQAPLSEVALFVRCYQHLTNKYPAPTDARRMAVAAGTKTAVAACMEVLDTAQLQATGYINGHTGPVAGLATQANPPNAEGLTVLRTLNDFHRSWFPLDNFIDAATEPEGVMPRSREIHDEAEAALHLTRALLGTGVDFGSIVTGTSPLEALRSDGAAASSGGFLTAPSAGSSSVQNFVIERTFWGVLQGMRPMNATRLGRTGYGMNFPVGVKINESEGGGILGLKSYLLATLGQFKTENFAIRPMDGGLISPRRWSKAIYHDLLCRELPVIRLGDASAAPFVVNAPNAQTPPFRRGATCMQCHASMDQMAGTARALSYVGIPNWRGDFEPSVHVGRYAPTSPVPTRESEPLGMFNGSANNWEGRAPWGRLYYRSYDGTLVNQEVNGIPALGAAIAQQKDLYVCAASRYFQFFTGVQVDLRDEGDPSQPALSAGERAYRQIVVNLGTRLQQSRSLRTLVQEILNSPTYRATSLRETQ